MAGLALAFSVQACCSGRDIADAGENTSMLHRRLSSAAGLAWSLYVVIGETAHPCKYGSYSSARSQSRLRNCAMVTMLGSRGTFDTIARMTTVSWLRNGLHDRVLDLHLHHHLELWRRARHLRSGGRASLYLVPVLAVIAGALHARRNHHRTYAGGRRAHSGRRRLRAVRRLRFRKAVAALGLVFLPEYVKVPFTGLTEQSASSKLKSR